MKRLFYLFFGITIILSSCQDVIDVDLNNGTPKLVIDARLELNGDNTTTATVKLTRSAPFFQEQNTVVNDAQVSVTDSNGIRYDFTLLNSFSGIYVNNSLAIQENLSYTLLIIDGSNRYTATETLVKTVPITEVVEESLEAFGDNDTKKITAFFNDPVGLGDKYLFEYQDANNLQLDAGDDDFFDGNRTPTIFFIEDLQSQTPISLRIKGLDNEAYLYYFKLIEQGSDGGRNPFSTPVATIKGNIINTTNRNLSPFGYFRVSQVFEFNYTSL